MLSFKLFISEKPVFWPTFGAKYSRSFAPTQFIETFLIAFGHFRADFKTYSLKGNYKIV